MTAVGVELDQVYVIELRDRKGGSRYYTGRRDHDTWKPLAAKTPARALRYVSRDMCERDMVNHCADLPDGIYACVRAVPA